MRDTNIEKRGILNRLDALLAARRVTLPAGQGRLPKISWSSSWSALARA
jgi:hypothetical protein